MRLYLFTCAITAAVTVTLAAQQPRPTFDVASIKRNATGEEMMTFRTMPDGTVLMSNVTLQVAISRAYPDQFAVVDLPGWASSERYDITAKAPAGSAAAASPAMLRDLFADRLKLRVHVEMRDVPSYALVLAREDRRPGPALKVSALDCANVPPRPANAPIPTLPAPEEAKTRCGGIVLRGELLSGGMTMAALANMLRGPAGRPVDDKTGLTGYYSVVLPITTGTLAGPADGPSIFTALVEQLGLKLEPARMPVQVLVVDSIEHPSND
jgi:uncharacterized protein (TIGR03435 family)